MFCRSPAECFVSLATAAAATQRQWHDATGGRRVVEERCSGENLIVLGRHVAVLANSGYSALLFRSTPRNETGRTKPRLAGSCKYRRCSGSAWNRLVAIHSRVRWGGQLIHREHSALHHVVLDAIQPVTPLSGAR
jgi:hypothetical protein